MLNKDFEEIENKELYLHELFQTLLRQKVFIIIFSVFSVFGGFYYITVKAEDTYVATSIFGFDAKAEIPAFAGALANIGQFVGLNGSRTKDALLTQIQSKDFLNNVVTNLNLHKNPEFFSLPKD